jgi:predicted dehydrogenase
MKSRKQLNVAMIGQGFMGRAHSNAFHQVGHFCEPSYDLRLKVICGRNQPQLEATASRWGWEETSTDWRATVERKDIDVIDICTPNYLHAPIAIAAAQVGKMILCEKPLAMSVAEAEQMASAAQKVPTLVWFNYRRVPAIALAKSLVDVGRLGQIYHYRATYLQSWGADPVGPDAWRFRQSEAGSGAMGDLLSHSIDLAVMLNGPIEEVSALVHTFIPARQVDDAVLTLVRFTNGSVGSFEATRFAIGCRNRNYFEIHGAKGAIRFDLEDLNRLHVFSAEDGTEVQGSHNVLVTGPGHPYTSAFWPPGHILGYEHTFILTLADFLRSLEKDETFHVNFQDAVNVQKVLHAVDESARTRSWARTAA